MKFIPLTVTDDLIQPILDDAKLVTRRILGRTDQNKLNAAFERIPEAQIVSHEYAQGIRGWQVFEPNRGNVLVTLGRGYQPGDVLWIKETHYAYGYWRDVEGTFTPSGRQKSKFHIANNGFHGVSFNPGQVESNSSEMLGWYKRLARFMPKKFCRTFLEVEEVRIERVNAITEEDAHLEGIKPLQTIVPAEIKVRYQVGFINIWTKLHGVDAWLHNDWVYRIKFRRIEKPANFLTH